MTKILFASICMILALNVKASECESLVKKIYDCGERNEYTALTVCDDGEFFNDKKEAFIEDLVVEIIHQDESALRCDFSYPASYTERCYGEINQVGNSIKLDSYKCFDLETGKKIYSSSHL